MAKDPKRQLLGKIARQKGQYFEQRLDSTFDYYRERGYAEIEKTPEPMTMPTTRQIAVKRPYFRSSLCSMFSLSPCFELYLSPFCVGTPETTENCVRPQ